MSRFLPWGPRVWGSRDGRPRPLNRTAPSYPPDAWWRRRRLGRNLQREVSLSSQSLPCSQGSVRMELLALRPVGHLIPTGVDSAGAAEIAWPWLHWTSHGDETTRPVAPSSELLLPISSSFRRARHLCGNRWEGWSHGCALLPICPPSRVPSLPAGEPAELLPPPGACKGWGQGHPQRRWPPGEPWAGTTVDLPELLSVLGSSGLCPVTPSRHTGVGSPCRHMGVGSPLQTHGCGVPLQTHRKLSSLL